MRASESSTLIQGLYAITPDDADTAHLKDRVDRCLRAGVRLLQYRNKTASATLKRSQLEALIPLCASHRCFLIVNDDWQLARSLGIPGVHVGTEDGDVRLVRDELGPDALIGVSCYSSLQLAAEVAPHADYLAFGSVFPSTTKPRAPAAALTVLGAARDLGKPIVAIGGITAENAATAFAAGADAIAVISALFAQDDIASAARAFIQVGTDAMRRRVADAGR